jgi:hypothetical protein
LVDLVEKIPRNGAAALADLIEKKLAQLNVWKNCGGGLNSSNLLLTQLGFYRNGDEPFDDPYVEGTSTPINWWISVEMKKGEDPIRKLALKMHGIMPHNANCERVFSILGWFLSKRRTK